MNQSPIAVLTERGPHFTPTPARAILFATAKALARETKSNRFNPRQADACQTISVNAPPPHSDEMHVTERLRRINGGKQLEDIVTVQDPKNYTKPWSARFVYDFHPELRLEAYVCGEAHRDLSKVKGVRGV